LLPRCHINAAKHLRAFSLASRPWQRAERLVGGQSRLARV
jgi:hypothetical protein